MTFASEASHLQSPINSNDEDMSDNNIEDRSSAFDFIDELRPTAMDKSEFQIVNVNQLVGRINSYGSVVGHGPYKGTVTISVDTNSMGGTRVDFCIGYSQGLKLIRKIKESTSCDDVENILPDDAEEGYGVYHLLARHSDSLYSIRKPKPNWYEVDLYRFKCPTCNVGTSDVYKGAKQCIPLK